MSRKSWNGVTGLSCSAKRDRKRPLLRSPGKRAAFAPSFPACLRYQGNADYNAESEFTRIIILNYVITFLKQPAIRDR